MLSTVLLSLSLSSSSSSYLSKTSSVSLNILFKRASSHLSNMSINFQFHAFAGNPIRSSKTPKQSDPISPTSSFETLKNLLLNNNITSPLCESYKVLPFRKGRPLACSNSEPLIPIWHLQWLSLSECKSVFENSKVELSENKMVYLGGREEEESVVYWGIDVTMDDELVGEFGKRKCCFVELRTLMVATDCSDVNAMGELAIAGHARALLEWHNVSQFCGSCGERTIPMEAGKRRQCPNDQCKKRIYPRVDPVVIMLVIDRENDRALLSRQLRFVPRMWSCLAGFLEPGESLEEAVRRETWEETGIEVGEVIYHSSQPWPVGPSSMPCQLMVGFFAYAKSLEINVDKEELDDAQWHSREDVKNALTIAEYEKEQKNAAAKVDQMCKGVEKGQSLAGDFNVESGELAPMFVPGPFAIAHHLISSWVYQGTPDDSRTNSQPLAGSLSNL